MPLLISPNSSVRPARSWPSSAFGAADAPVALQEQPRADRVRPAGDQGESAVEAVEAVLLDGERVEIDADAVGLAFPFRERHGIGEVRFVPAALRSFTSTFTTGPCT